MPIPGRIGAALAVTCARGVTLAAEVEARMAEAAVRAIGWGPLVLAAGIGSGCSPRALDLAEFESVLVRG
jgi:hypothetical protein